MPKRPMDSHKYPLRSGDPDAFDRLYVDLAPRVLGYLLRLTGSRTEAEDLVQDTFLAAYVGRATYGGQSLPLAWLLGIARRRWRDNRRKPLPETLPLFDDSSEPSTSGPEERVARSATLEWALARLNEAERDALLLVAMQGLSYHEAAEIMGEPMGTVKWRVHEATRTLRHILKDWEENHEAPNASAASRPDNPACRR